jgi:hypothetical protein
VSCQSDSFATCETEVVEECRTHCETTGGGIFCDGQFLATGNLEACAAELESEMDIHVDLSVTAQAEANVEGRGVGCSVDPAGGRTASLHGLLGLLLAVCVWRTTRGCR